MKKNLFFILHCVFFSLKLAHSLDLNFVIDGAKKCFPSEKFNLISLIFSQRATDSEINNVKNSFLAADSFFVGLNER
jgi:hypothetical protein